MTRSIGIIFLLFTALVLVFSPGTILAAPGDLDTSFGTGGVVTTDIMVGNTDEGHAVAIQADGKIVVAGVGYSGIDFDFELARYNIDGSLDTSFGTNGIVITDLTGLNDWATSIAIQADGKIIVAGAKWEGSNAVFALVRYNIDGSLDTSFGTTGIVTTDLSGSNDLANAISIQPDGKIVAAGYTGTANNDDFAVVRYNTDGSLDTGFGTGGKVTTDVSGGYDRAGAMVIQADGKIVMVGSSGTAFGNLDFGLVRYNTDGSLDTSFDTDGIVITNIGRSISELAMGAAIQADGKIVVASGSWNGSGNDLTLVRYNTNGSLDTSFDADGIVITDNPLTDDEAYAVAIQPDGKIVAAGDSFRPGSYDFMVARYNTDGSLDTSFGTTGIVTPDVYNTDIAQAMALQSDGKVVAAGSGLTAGGESFFVLMRFIGQAGDTASLNVTTSGTGTGTVTSDPLGIDSPSDGSEDFNLSTIVTLTAVANAGSTFISWTGDCTGTDATCQVTMDQARNVTAVFDLEGDAGGQGFATLNITTSGTGTGVITSDLAGIDCPGDCTEDFNPDTIVTLTAAPDAGLVFIGWIGDGIGTGATLQVTMDQAMNVTALFNLASNPFCFIGSLFNI